MRIWSKHRRALICVGHCPSTLCSSVLVHLILRTALRGRCSHHLHFAAEETEAQRGWVSCPTLYKKLTTFKRSRGGEGGCRMVVKLLRIGA